MYRQSIGVFLSALWICASAWGEVGAFRVSAGGDDAEESASGQVRTTSSDLELAEDDGMGAFKRQAVGICFRNVNVPRGCHLKYARIQFVAKDATGGPCSLRIRCQDTGDAAGFDEAGSNITRRVLTECGVTWNPPAWAAGDSGEATVTPDLKVMIDPVLKRKDWRSGGTLVFVIQGEGVRRAWSFNGRADSAPVLRMEWIAADVTGGEPTVAEPGEGAAGDADRSDSLPSRSTINEGAAGEWFHCVVDDLAAVGLRLLDLPLIVLVAITGLAGVLVIFLAMRVRSGRARWKVVAVVVAFVLCGFVVAVARCFDKKVVALREEVRVLRSRQDTDALGLLDVLRERHNERKKYLFDLGAAKKELQIGFGPTRVFPVVYDEAADVVFIRMWDPLVHAYLAIIDLSRPEVRICIGTNTTRKTLTSDFACSNDCTIAMNGEAGRSPGPACGFGDWVGNLICEGRPVLLEDSPQRPFLAFDRQNLGTYVRASVVDRAAGPDRYNVIWGRWDALVDGVVQQPSSGDRQPRTVMALDKEGRRLYLLVVDGRQAGYSLGLSRCEAAAMVKAFGASNGMLCDEGGSVCIYFRKFGGISSSPSDQQGKERPTYTHFGVCIQKRK